MNYPTAAYLHIPFCRRRCYYCDFAISVVGDNPLKNDSSIAVDYVNYLCREIELTAIKDKPLQTVFFGGGTPSLLPVKQLETILVTLEKYLGIAPHAEISLEIDPGTFDRDRLQRYIDLGLNRLSLGVQTFDSKLLEICGRTHNTKDIYNAIASIRQTSLKNFSIDLITGLPHQTIEHCRQSLEKAIKIAPPHISCYDLVLESVTAFGKQYQQGIAPLPTDEATRTMYQLTQQMLTRQGYQHYEISNYARTGYWCRHNRVYWENKPYYGFGMSAASYFNNMRFSRPRTRKTYYNWVLQGAIIDAPPNTANDDLLETLMLSLRLAEGVSLSRITRKYGRVIASKILSCLKPYIEQKLVAIDDIEGFTRIKLSDPEGFLLSNTILATLFDKLERATS